jgi:hypothetical protein
MTEHSPHTHTQQPSPTMTETPPAQSVRFSDVTQEIEPEEAVRDVAELTGTDKAPNDGPLSPQAEEELRNLSSTLQKSRMQAKRMENFSFEPVSLPPSRVSKPHELAHGLSTLR